jgi:hypothetical protein
MKTKTSRRKLKSRRKSKRKSNIRSKRKSNRRSKRKFNRRFNRRFGTDDRRLNEGGQIYNVYYGPDNFLLANDSFSWENNPQSRALNAE